MKESDDLKSAAVIAEFNPFHNGHKHLIDQIKSSASDETGFDDILAEIEANAGIAPVKNNYDAIEDFLKSFPVETPAEQDPIRDEANEAAKSLSDITISAHGQEQVDDVADSVSLPVTETPDSVQPDAFVGGNAEAESSVNTDSEEFERELANIRVRIKEKSSAITFQK